MNIKLTASQSHVMCTRFTWSVRLRTLKSVDIAKAFHGIGYTWKDDRIDIIAEEAASK